MSKVDLYKGDALEVMDELIAKGVVVDAIIADTPYGTTACKWDSIIPFDAMWERLNKLIKPNGAIVLFGSEPFSSLLRASNLKMFKYDWIWSKSKSQHFAQAPYRPMTNHETVSVFSNGGTAKNAKNRMVYNPQGTESCNRECKGKSAKHSEHRQRQTDQADYIQTTTNYPKTILQVSNEGRTKHPTQKPIAIMEYLVATYTNENELVLDFTMGSGTTGVACKNLGRDFIGIELDDKYFTIAKDRILIENMAELYDIPVKINKDKQ